MRNQLFLKLLLLFFVGFIGFSASAQSPGGVGTGSGLNLWLKANSGPQNGVSAAVDNDPITLWLDQSGLGRDYTAVAGPTLKDKTLNFNPSVEILAGGFDAPALAALPADWTVFFISQKLASDNNGRLFDGNTGNYLWAHWSNFVNGIYLTGNPASNGSGIATTSGILNLHLHSYKRESGTVEARADGASLAIYGSTNSAAGIRIDINTGFYAASESSNSRVGEMIIYNTALTGTEIDKVESYLGIKYGLTLAHNYVASNGTLLWDYGTSTAYNNNIAGIGLDNSLSGSGLNQPKSKSINAGSLVTINNGGSFADLNFLLWGDNNAANGASSDVPATYAKRINKVWKTSSTGTPGLVDVTIDLTDLGLPVGLASSDYAILIDDDGVFNNALGFPGTNRTGSLLTFSGVSFSNTQFFSVAVSTTALKGPANVTDNLKLWLKADVGVAGATPITSWTDQAGNGYIATAPGNAPDLLNSQLNFNPILDFTSASSEYLQIANGIMGSSTYNDVWVYTVHKADAIQANTIFYENMAAGERINVLLPWNDSNIYFDYANGGASGRLNGAWGGSINSYNLWTLGSSTSTITPSGFRKAISKDGVVMLSNNSNDGGTGNNQPFSIGGGYATGLGTSNPFDGKIAEMIVYTGVPTALEQQKVESYLGIKYGLTLAHDYVASNGTTIIWDYTGSAAYNNNIAGIGRDNGVLGSELNQTKSQSINAGADITVEMGLTPFANLDFVAWGDNNATNGTSTDVPAGYAKRINKIWKTQSTVAPAAVNLTIDLTDLGLPVGLPASDYALIIDGDPTFSDAVAPIAGSTRSGSQLTFSGVSFSGSQFFTVAVINTALVGPANVTDNLKLWLKADVGVTGGVAITNWGDQSGNGYQAINPSIGAPKPAWDNVNLLNFNPVVDFTNSHLKIGDGIVNGIMGTSSYTSSWTYAVVKGDVLQNNTLFYESLAGNENFNALVPWGGNSIFLDFGSTSTGRINTTSGASINAYNLWTMGATTSSSAPLPAGANNKGLFRDGSLLLSLAGTDATVTGNNQPMFIGGGFNTGPTADGTQNQLDGKVAELIVYTGVPTAVEQQKIETYLGIKYGLSLAHDYVASNGTTIWNSATNSVYHNNVAGVGRDLDNISGSGLNQPKSKSMNAGSDITITAGALPANAISYIVWGDNNAANGTSIQVPTSTYSKRINKIWKTKLTNSPGLASISIDLTDLGLPIGLTAGDYALLLDADGDFSNASDHITGAALVGGQLSFTLVPFIDDGYFTVAIKTTALKGPANVTENLKLWLKADVGVSETAGSVTAWADKSGNGYIATPPGTAPVLLPGQLNFNPVVDFTNSHLKIFNGTTGIMGSTLSTYTSSWTYAVMKGDVSGNATLFYESLAGGETFNVLLPWSSNAYIDFGNAAGAGRLNGPWGGNINTYNMWTLGASTAAASTPNLTNKAISRDGFVFLSNNTADATIAGNNQPFFIGGGYNTGTIADGTQNQLDGKIAELIVYTGVPTELEQEKILSYLAVKYGLTKNSTDAADGAVDGRNYFASDGSIIWNYASSYNNSVTGIGHDDASQLDQLKSKSITTGSVLTLEKKAPFFPGGIHYIVTADDAGVLASSSASVPSPYTKRLTRVWSANVKGSPGPISVSFDLTTGIHNSGNAADYALLINNGVAAFGSPTSTVTGATILNNVLTFDNVTLSNNDYFTLGIVVKNPGGIPGSVFWVKGGAGVTATPTDVSLWADQSGGGNNAVQATIANQPSIGASVNFNPTVDFSGSTDIFSITSPPANLNTTIFTVGVPTGPPGNTTWRTMFRGTVNDHPLILQSGNNALGYYDNVGTPSALLSSGFTWLQNETALVGLEMLPSNVNFRKNGTQQGSPITSVDLTGVSLNFFGNYQGFGQNFGAIAETVIFSGSALLSADKDKIESYLAVKYGITMAHDYVNTSGATTWNLTTNAGYNNSITGIGLDDITALDQRKSKSVVSGSVLTIEKTTSLAPFTPGLQFLIVGDDAGSLSATTVGVPSGFPAFPMRVTRIWKTQITGTPGTATISFDLGTGIYNSGVDTQYSLLISNTNTFSAVTPVTGGSISGNVISFSNVPLADGQYFTLGLPFITSPGNVINNLTVWLKADEGVLAADGVTPAVNGDGVSQWSDQTSLLNHAAATFTAARPAYNTSSNLINFNPTLYYDGTNGHNLSYSVSGQYTIFTMARLEGTQNGRVFSSRNSNSFLGFWNNRQDVVYLNNNPSHLTGLPATTNPRLHAFWRESSTGAYQFYTNGGILNSGPTSLNVTWQMGIANGGQSTGEKAKAYVSELIMYDRTLTPSEINSVQSYLGIKYGVTLDQTTPTHYVASDGTIIWDASASPAGNASYKNNIAGIGRDNNTRLNQIKSQSINAKSVVIMDKGGALTNKTFLVWGNDNNALAPTSVSAVSPYPYRLARVWRVDQTGAIGTVSVSFDLSTGIFNSGNASDYALVQKTADTNFSSGATVNDNGSGATPSFDVSGNILTFHNVTFNDGDYFTLALPNIAAPGGVVGSVQLWLKADKDVTDPGPGNTFTWKDQSGNGFNVTQPTTASKPVILTSQANFNPAVKFDGTDDQLALTGGIMGTNTYTDFNAVVVSRANANVTNTMFFETQGAGGRINAHIPWNNNNIYWDAGDAGTNRLNGIWGGAINSHSLWTLTASSNATASGAKQDIYKNGLRILFDNTMTTPSAFTGNNSNFFLGSQGGSSYYNGDFSEIILYTGSLSTNQLQRINSYFALKYGLTLDQSLPQNYIASNSSIFYHAGSASYLAYVTDIAGIGRDNNSALDQRKSQSANVPSDIFAAANNTASSSATVESDFALPAPFGADLQFFVWGHNGLPPTSDATTASLVNYGTPAGEDIVRRLARVWTTDKTPNLTAGNLIIELDVSKIGGPSGPGTNDVSKLRLLLDDNTSFTDHSPGERLYPATASAVPGKIYFIVSYADLGAQSFITLGSTDVVTAPLMTPTPGGVATNLRIWLKANQGATASLWNDYSGNSFNAVAGTNAPSISLNRLNFNPSVVFNGTNQSMVVPNGILRGAMYSDANVFVVSMANSPLQNNQIIFESTLTAQFVPHLPWADGNVYWDAGNSGTNRLYGNWGGTLNQSFLWSMTANTNFTPGVPRQEIFRNGLRFLTDNTMSNFSGNNSTFYVGSGAGNYWFKGEISELVVIGSAMNTSEFQRVQSYLAVKYGITLNQTIPQNYFSSTDAVIYHATTSHGNYLKDITGIGRDDNSALMQVKSKNSTAVPDLISISNGNFLSPVNFIDAPEEYLLWGNNGLPYSADAATAPYNHAGGPEQIVRQLARVWSTDKTANLITGSAVIEVDMSLVGGPGGLGTNDNSKIRLLIDKDAVFGNNLPASAEHVYSLDPAYSPIPAQGGKIYFTVPFSDIPAGQGFFTIGSVDLLLAPISIPYPGGVATNIRLWLKANDGVGGVTTAATWTDRSNNGFTATSSAQPTINANSINFNPALQFNGATSMLIAGGILGTNTYKDVNAFVVDRPTVGSGQVFREATTGGQLATYVPSTDNNVYWDAGTSGAPNRIITNWGGTFLSPYIWSFAASTNLTSTLSTRQDIYRNTQRIASDGDMNPFIGNNSNFTIGYDGGGTFHRGETSEIVIYTGGLDATQMQRIHSYLAIKYGVTLDQTAPQNYLASNGSSIYHTTSTHSGYKNQIAGIGRDDDSALDQRKSKSINTGAVITMEKDNPLVMFGSDKDFVIWGDDGLSNAVTTTGAVNATYPTRTTKTWRVDTNGSPGMVTVSFDLNAGIYNSTNPTEYAILIKNADNDFRATSPTGAPAIHTSGATISSGVLTFTGVNFTDLDYFTLAMPRPPAPGGVINNLKVWLKANAGITATEGTVVTQWVDQTQLGNNATNTGSPIYRVSTATPSNLINFNPSVYYDGASGHNLTYSVSGAYTIFTMARLEGTQNRRVFSSRSSNFLIGFYNGKENVLHINGAPSLLTGVAATTTPRLYSLVRATTPGGYSMWNSGALLYSGPTSDAAPMQWSMGNGGQSNESSRAYVSESIIYDINLTTAEISAVQSYLAIKYGITIDQTVATDYTFADGLTIWSGATFSAYNKNITGIGRHNRSALDQRQSKSINASALVTMANHDLATPFSDNSFIVFGNDAGLLGPTSLNVPVASYPYRVGRIWKASVTGTPGTVDLSFDLNPGIYNSLNADDYGLLIKNSSTDFSTGATILNHLTVLPADVPTLAAGILTFHNVTLTNLDNFCLALPIVPAPGGVVDNMQLWIKSNTGVPNTTPGSAVTSWTDQSGNGFNLSQGTAGAIPVVAPATNLVNFNPSVSFDGNDQLTYTPGIMGTGTYNNFNSFMVARTNALPASASSVFYETQAGTGGRISVRLPNTSADLRVFWEAGSTSATNQLAATWGASINTNYLWGFTATTPAPARQEIFRNGASVSFDTNMAAFSGNGSPFFMGSTGGAGYYNGEVAENVIYAYNNPSASNALQPNQLARIQSYFAVKYGITLSQTPATNYYASDWNGTTGTLIWNSTSAGVYKNDIAAIGFDKNSALDQRQSASANTGNVLVIAHNTSITSSASSGNAFGADKTFFSWAHNNLALNGEAVTNLPATIQSRVARVWQGQETGNAGPVHLKFNLSTVMGAGGIVGNNDMTKVRLLVDTDEDFSTGATVVPTVAAFDNTAHTVEFNFDFPAGAISYFTVGSVDKATAPLPIQLVSFTATPKEDKVEVAWKTLTELDNDFFTVQSSVDGFEWGEVQEVKGAGNSSTPKTYEITDENPFIGKSYYRLRQTDFSSKMTFSKVVEVTINEGSIKVYPNPVSDGKINIQIKDNLSEQLQIRLLDSQQRELKSQTYQRNASQQSTIIMDLPDQLPSGMYYLKIIDKTGIRYRRIIVN